MGGPYVKLPGALNPKRRLGDPGDTQEILQEQLDQLYETPNRILVRMNKGFLLLFQEGERRERIARGEIV